MNTNFLDKTSDESYTNFKFILNINKIHPSYTKQKKITKNQKNKTSILRNSHCQHNPGKNLDVANSKSYTAA